MSSNSSNPSLIEAVLTISRHSTWTLESHTRVEGDVGHPQGLTTHEDNWVVTSVHPSTGRGVIHEFDRSGSRRRELDVTDAERIHPGGIDWWTTGANMWVPVAEYRPHSTSTIVRIDSEFRVRDRFAVHDHLGAICDLGDGTLLAVSWGSRHLYRLTHTGEILERRLNPSHMIDYQDLQMIAPGFVLATGVAGLAFDGETRQLGGLAVIDTADLHIVHEVPITATMPSGRSITYNGFHIEVQEGRVRFHCLVDDTRASIGHWTVN